MKIWLAATVGLMLVFAALTARASTCSQFATQILAADRAYDLVLQDLEPDFMLMPYAKRAWRCDAARGAAMMLQAQVVRQVEAERACAGSVTFPRDLSYWERELASMRDRIGEACGGKEDLLAPNGAEPLWEVCSCFSLQQLDPGAGKHRRFRAVNACPVPIRYAYASCHKIGNGIGCGLEHGRVAASTTHEVSGHSDYSDATLQWACSPGIPCCRSRR